MALQSSTVWEVRTTGNDANGGGFAAGASGSDYSQQDAAQVVYTDLVIGTTSTQITSAANPFTPAHVGNLLNVVGGTGFTPGRYQVSSVAGGVATMDRAVGTGGSTGGSGSLGGAMATIGGLAVAMVGGNRAFIKGGIYGLTTPVTFTQSGPATNVPCWLIGYAATRGDVTLRSGNQSARPQIVANAAGIGSLVTFSGNNWALQNLIFGAGTNAPNTALEMDGTNVVLVNLRVAGFGQYGILGYYIFTYFGCEVTGGLPGSSYGVRAYLQSLLSGCWVHDNNCTGVYLGSASAVEYCLVANNSGAVSDGIFIYPGQAVVRNCVVWKSGRHGVSMGSSPAQTEVLGNILSENGGYGLAGTTASPLPALPPWDGNAFYMNAAGARSSLDNTAGVNGVTPYINTRDVTLTADPFVNKAGNDFRLNGTPGGGPACRAAAPGFPGFGSPSVPYQDMGALQHADSGGISKSRLMAGV